MTRRVKSPCLTCGTPTHGTRCPRHTLSRPTYAENQRRAAAVQNWITQVGYWCPGWNRDGHHTTDLTADHIQPRSHHGDNGPLRILCRSCNSARGNQTKPR